VPASAALHAQPPQHERSSAAPRAECGHRWQRPSGEHAGYRGWRGAHHRLCPVPGGMLASPWNDGAEPAACRGVVTGTDGTRTDLRERYRGWFSGGSTRRSPKPRTIRPDSPDGQRRTGHSARSAADDSRSGAPCGIGVILPLMRYHLGGDVTPGNGRGPGRIAASGSGSPRLGHAYGQATAG